MGVLICSKCRKNEPTPGMLICDFCRKKTNKRNSVLRDRVTTPCSICGKLHQDKKANGQPYKTCLGCRTKGIEAYKNNKSKQKVIEGECYSCGGTVDSAGHTRCDRCRELNRQAQRQTRAKRERLGLCLVCGSEKQDTTLQRCHNCVFKALAASSIGDRRRWQELKQLFITQRGLCAYTGDLLYIGKNASIDHRVPVSKGGSNDLENLQWVHSDVNHMKYKLFESEFFVLVEKIHNHRDR